MNTTENIDKKIENILEKSAKVETNEYTKPTTFNFNKNNYILGGIALPKGVDSTFLAKIQDDVDKVYFKVMERKPNSFIMNYYEVVNEFKMLKTNTKFWSNISLGPPTKGGKKSKKTKKSTKKQRKTRKHKK
jgi:hypothetical protein